jgi:hypothetical protein
MPTPSTKSSPSLAPINSSDATPDARHDAMELMGGASETASEIYAQANTWLSQNRRTVYIGAGVLAVGLIGFMIGRSVSSSASE